jgi:hypothetical protein
MLVCKSCNTRFGRTMQACPSCGRRAADHAIEESATAGRPQAPSPLPPRATGAKASDPEVELEEVAVVKPKPKAQPGAPSVASTPNTNRPATPQPVAHVRPKTEPGPTVFHLNPSQVRTLIAEQPDLIAKGLSIHTDETGKAVGANFSTPVGTIDVLARDAKGNYTVVMVPEQVDPARIVPDILQRMGWVRKHMAADDDEVRSIVVLEQLPEDVAYAAAGAGGNLAFKAFRVALTFHDLDT